jgi:hypothetical protein
MTDQVDTLDEILDEFNPFDNSYNDFLRKKPLAKAKLSALLVDAELNGLKYAARFKPKKTGDVNLEWRQYFRSLNDRIKDLEKQQQGASASTESLTASSKQADNPEEIA